MPVPAVDALHRPGHEGARWSTANVGEAFPVPPTALSWTFSGAAVERILRGAFFEIGALGRAELGAPADPSGRFVTIFHGTPAVNVDLFRTMGDRMPGSSGDAVEGQLFGETPPASGGRGSWEYYPRVLARLPWSAVRARNRLLHLVATTEPWWQRWVAVIPGSGASRTELLGTLDEVFDRFVRIGIPHTVLSMVAVGLYDRTAALCAHAGLPDLVTTLLTPDETEESRLVADLWRVSCDELSLADFLAVHGYHGPVEGEISSRSWREDPSPVSALLAPYRDLDASRAPGAAAAQRAARRDDAERTLLARLPRHQRSAVRRFLRLARHLVTFREVGRGTFLKAIDVARITCREIGTDLVGQSQLSDREDVFHLLWDELRALPAHPAALAAERRMLRESQRGLRLPQRWTGDPEPLPDTASTEPVHGLGVSPGIVEGDARVIHDPEAAEEVHPGEILVCRTTDPSWASQLFVSAGVVIEIGGPMSHGAIVSRELGIPCVISARDATRRLHTGDRVRIDGQTGTVEVLRRA